MLGEKALHAQLKRWYAVDGDEVEQPVDRFVIDLVRDDLLIEIQTGGFSGLKRKLRALLDAGYRVRVVHPIAASKWIVKQTDDGEDRRRSPKRGRIIDVFGQLVAFPRLIDHPGLEIEVLLTHEDEVRRHEPGKAWRRKGWVVEERRLIGVVDGVLLGSSGDLVALLPAGLTDPFTTADLAEALACRRRIAQQMAYCLRQTDALVIDGKEGNALTYRRP